MIKQVLMVQVVQWRFKYQYRLSFLGLDDSSVGFYDPNESC